MCERTDKDVARDQKIIDAIGDRLEKLEAENKALKASRDDLLEDLKEAHRSGQNKNPPGHLYVVLKNIIKQAETK